VSDFIFIGFDFTFDVVVSLVECACGMPHGKRSSFPAFGLQFALSQQEVRDG